jgi:hypothetical protein
MGEPLPAHGHSEKHIPVHGQVCYAYIVLNIVTFSCFFSMLFLSVITASSHPLTLLTSLSPSFVPSLLSFSCTSSHHPHHSLPPSFSYFLPHTLHLPSHHPPPTHTHSYTHTHTYSHIHIHIRSHIHTNKHTHSHSHTHTHYRSYALQTPGVKSLWDLGLELFRRRLEMRQEVESKLVTGLLAAIEAER